MRGLHPVLLGSTRETPAAPPLGRSLAVALVLQSPAKSASAQGGHRNFTPPLAKSFSLNMVNTWNTPDLSLQAGTLL